MELSAVRRPQNYIDLTYFASDRIPIRINITVFPFIFSHHQTDDTQTDKSKPKSEAYYCSCKTYESHQKAKLH